MSLICTVVGPHGRVPTRAHPDDAGFDLYSATSGSIPPRGSALISTDITISIPPGYYGRVASRSGLACRYSVEVGAGVIDRGYTGVVQVLLRNFSDSPFVYQVGDRIAQLIITAYYTGPIQSTSETTAPNEASTRGAGGFGSTGVGSTGVGST